MIEVDRSSTNGGTLGHDILDTQMILPVFARYLINITHLILFTLSTKCQAKIKKPQFIKQSFKDYQSGEKTLNFIF